MYKFRDLAATCKDFAFDGNKRSVFNDFVIRNPPVTNVVVEPECYELKALNKMTKVNGTCLLVLFY